MVILITGARKGIGRFLAEAFLADGATVYGCSRSPSDLQHVNYTHFETDVSDEAGVRSLFSQIRKLGAPLHAVVNNAGIASMNHLLLTPLEKFKSVVDTNLLGTFLITREAAKTMKRSRFGRIVNFSTVAVPLMLEGEAAYAASKAGVVTFTQVAARELAEYGITVNAIGPTPIKTDLIRGVPEDKIAGLIERQAIKRLGEHSDVLNVIRFFLQPESDFVTGQTIYLGGV